VQSSSNIKRQCRSLKLYLSKVGEIELVFESQHEHNIDSDIDIHIRRLSNGSLEEEIM